MKQLLGEKSDLYYSFAYSHLAYNVIICGIVSDCSRIFCYFNGITHISLNVYHEVSFFYVSSILSEFEQSVSNAASNLTIFHNV